VGPRVLSRLVEGEFREFGDDRKYGVDEKKTKLLPRAAPPHENGKPALQNWRKQQEYVAYPHGLIASLL
jgi:hypothetical protein